ncbi:hypothetical protein ACFL20_06505, partial [Spirochaetota bacterium]
MGNIFYFAFSLAYVFLFIYAFRLTKNKDLQYKIFLIILAALFYDNFISAMGFILGDGQLLKGLNFFRFAFHVFITPLLCFVVYKMAQKGGIKIFQSRVSEIAVWIFSAILIAMGFVHDILPNDLIPHVKWGVLKYTHATPSVPIFVILVIIFIIAVAVIIWRKKGWPELFIGSMFMFL